jgi:hypothetical protein
MTTISKVFRRHPDRKSTAELQTTATVGKVEAGDTCERSTSLISSVFSRSCYVTSFRDRFGPLNPSMQHVEIKTINKYNLREISSSHEGEYEAQNLLGCTAMFLIEFRPTFRRYQLPPTSGR